MKVTHLFLLAVALLCLVSSGFANRPRTRRECYQANGGCRYRRCSFPMMEKGRCNSRKRCCVRQDNDRNRGESETWNLWDPLKH
nr:PREDICTED: gallinacin-1 alpha-like isoform X2 [Anolis carolinensis]|eukprot:XP_016853175.1 PREDICTED: gallinacin-1 alpha-like isoform X2 [Anolis carolinensis]